MELRHLRYFIVLAEELHFRKAAERLFITQPPLSRQIKCLEEELGIKLFRRTKKSVQLTSYGIYLKDEAEKVVRQVDVIKRHLKLLKEGTVGQIRIGYVGAVMHSLLPDVLKKLRIDYPEINTVLLELDTERQIAALRSGDLDIGFIRTPIEVKDICVRPVYSETFSLILPLSHPLANSGEFSLKELADEPFISFTRSCAPGMNDKIISICQKEGFSPKLVHESSQINSILRLVESDLGYSIVPSGVKTGYNLRVKFIELDKYPERAELSLAYNTSYLIPAYNRIIDMILETVC